ncbi:MAG: cyclomaltodextrinase C-terminal domain-containing protein, partial [Pelomonas sp.]|nr:cyclomaltodextrinase C-terminal domain-containing protein [Roseateles sp.]
NATVHDGALMQYAPLKGVYVFFRYDAQRTVMVVLNKNAQAVDLALDRFTERLRGGERARDVLGGRDFVLGRTLALPPRSPLVLEITR